MLNALEESDSLPMAIVTSSTSKPKAHFSNGLLTDTVRNYCKEKSHMDKECEKLQKKNEKDAQKGKQTEKKTRSLNLELVA